MYSDSLTHGELVEIVHNFDDLPRRLNFPLRLVLEELLAALFVDDLAAMPEGKVQVESDAEGECHGGHHVLKREGGHLRNRLLTTRFLWGIPSRFRRDRERKIAAQSLWAK